MKEFPSQELIKINYDHIESELNARRIANPTYDMFRIHLRPINRSNNIHTCMLTAEDIIGKWKVEGTIDEINNICTDIARQWHECTNNYPSRKRTEELTKYVDSILPRYEVGMNNFSERINKVFSLPKFDVSSSDKKSMLTTYNEIKKLLNEVKPIVHKYAMTTKSYSDMINNGSEVDEFDILEYLGLILYTLGYKEVGPYSGKW